MNYKLKNENSIVSICVGKIRLMAANHPEIKEALQCMFPEVFEEECRRFKIGTKFKNPYEGGNIYMLCQVGPREVKMIVVDGFDRGNRYSDTELTNAVSEIILPKEFDDFIEY
ncbi:MAG: hypothetical protein WC503_02865 [Candidatus Shapirobacteria bacterium]